MKIDNDTLKTLTTRRSCRRFKPDMISREELDAVLQAGTYAPTGRGKQSPIIIAITSKELRDQMTVQLRKVCGYPDSYDPFYGAPVILAVLADKNATPETEHAYINDGSLVMGNLLNAAASIGLGGCWIHFAKELFATPFGKEILLKLGITGNYEGIAHVALGYPEGPQPKAAKRKENYIYYI